MIRRLETFEHTPELLQRESVFCARICTQYEAYRGRADAPDFYSTEEGALFSYCDGVLTLEGAGFDAEELRQFLAMRGCHTLVCGEAAAKKLCITQKAQVTQILRYTGGAKQTDCRVERSPRLEGVFALLCDTFENMRGAVFSNWYCDVSLKIRRGIALVCGIYEDGSLCATAGIYYRNARLAVLGSVATAPKARGKGYAAAILSTLIAELQAQGVQPWIICQNERALALYRRLGFEEVGAYFEITTKEIE